MMSADVEGSGALVLVVGCRPLRGGEAVGVDEMESL